MGTVCKRVAFSKGLWETGWADGGFSTAPAVSTGREGVLAGSRSTIDLKEHPDEHPATARP